MCPFELRDWEIKFIIEELKWRDLQS
jgi:hypothetical protein